MMSEAVFADFHDNFDRNIKVVEKSRGFFKFIAFLSVFFSLVTIIIVYKASSKIKTEYRNILLSQLILALFGTVLISAISPHFLLPYPVLVIDGPLVDFRVTLWMTTLVLVLYFMPTMLLLSFGLIYNFMSLKQLTTHIFNISVDRIMKITIFCVAFVLLSGNMLFVCQLSNSESQMDLQKLIFETVDSRCRVIFEKYAVFVYDVNSWPICAASIEALVLSSGATVVCVVLTFLSCRHFERQKSVMSAAASRNHRMMLYMLISYVLHFLIYFSLPLTAFTISLYDRKPLLGNLTFILITSPAHFLGISLSVTYCLIITPYRKVVFTILMIITCSPAGRYVETNGRPISFVDKLVRRRSFRMSNQVSNA